MHLQTTTHTAHPCETCPCMFKNNDPHSVSLWDLLMYLITLRFFSLFTALGASDASVFGALPHHHRHFHQAHHAQLLLGLRLSLLVGPAHCAGRLPSARAHANHHPRIARADDLHPLCRGGMLYIDVYIDINIDINRVNPHIALGVFPVLALMLITIPESLAPMIYTLSVEVIYTYRYRYRCRYIIIYIYIYIYIWTHTSRWASFQCSRSCSLPFPNRSRQWSIPSLLRWEFIYIYIYMYIDIDR